MRRITFGWTTFLMLLIGIEAVGCSETPTNPPLQAGESGSGGQGGQTSQSNGSTSSSTSGAAAQAGNGGGGMAAQNATLLVEVTDQSTKLPVPGAVVRMGMTNTATNDAGQAYFENIAPGKTILHIESDGFLPSTSVANLDSDVHAATSVFLMRRGPALSFDADTGGNLEKDGIVVKIPPHAVVDAQGNPVSGPVDVTISPIDPTTDALLAGPGPLEGSTMGNSDPVPLASLFMADISLWQNGLPMNLAQGNLAELTFPIPTSLTSTVAPGDLVPAWWFDGEAAVWRQDGMGTIVETNGNTVWVANVSHFTPWNADKVADTTCVNVRVRNPMNQGLPGILVRIRGIDYQGQITSGLTDAQGNLCLSMQRGGTAEVAVLRPDGQVLSSTTVTGSSMANQCGGPACSPATLVISIPCAPLGAVVDCPGGPPNVGICKTGTRYCSTAGWGSCVGQILPKTETCNALDDDCDGTADDGNPGGGATCDTMQQGACKDGTLQCTGGALVCNALKMPTAETCDNVDEDCDGVIDNGNPGGGMACLTGNPAPCDQGVKTCQTGTILCVPTMVCPLDTCVDLMKNGMETDIDCGGAGLCDRCADGKTCLAGTDCTSKVCTGNVCQAPTCMDGVKNGNETDVNCGGGTCPVCGNGRACNVGPDCYSGVCTGHVCQVATCMDGVKNGVETDVDCGGNSGCPDCANGQVCLCAPAQPGCNPNSNCLSGKCTAGKCAP